MACSSTEQKYGYDDCRFEKDVDEHFHCSICYNVLKEPRTCRNNEHVFCLACITQHLMVNSQTCPECNEHLSVDTLRRPRVLNNYLSKLRINCDYASRGCPEFTCVEDLKTHVANCGFAPVLCSNENCGMEIIKQEKEHHETVVCEYRKVECHDRGQIKIGRLEGNLVELNAKLGTTEKKTGNNHADMRKIVGKLEVKVEAVIKRQAEIKQEVKNEVGEVKREIKDVKENLSKVNKDVDEVKVMMSQMLEKFNMLELMNNLPSPTEGMLKLMSNLPSPTEGMLNTRRPDILIAGGYGPQAGTGAEIYSWEKNGWFEVSPMDEVHRAASSFVYNDQLFVVAGEFSKTIETLDLNQLPLKWMKFPGELPYGSSDHQTVVYQQRVFHIGGYNYDKCERSNMISQLQLTTPCTMKKLCKMLEPRQCHGAEVLEDKVLVLGGEKSLLSAHCLGSVLEFDAKKNECKVMPRLPRPLSRMATVRWRDQVVVLGGCDKGGHVLNDVFMYDCKTGKTTALPSMLEKRQGCRAVITGDERIVVMGGDNEDGQTLSSVECFTMGGSTWENLPAMNKARWRAVAEVLPSTRKYV